MKSVKVLDVTLRDGGCVNNFNFGQTYMEQILDALDSSCVDIIEVGYIDGKRGTDSERTQYRNEKVITECLLTEKKPGVSYVAMIDYGKYDVEKLSKRTPEGIDGIRYAFHKENASDIVKIGNTILDKGYELYVQPMITLRYSDTELLELIELVNKQLPQASGFYIVDSFGEMRPNDMSRIMNLVDHNLIPKMTLGFHGHNNLQLAYSNAMAMIQFPTTRDILIDCSIMGMGKGAGNLNTELLLEHLNLFYGKDYKITPLLEVIDKVINQLHEEFYWGYAPEYYLSSTNHCSPSYAKYYYDKHMLPIDQVGELLSLIKDTKKISFDSEYAEELYRRYNEDNVVDDSKVRERLKDRLKGKNVLLVAPGSSINIYKNKILEVMSQDNIVSIGLNHDMGFDYMLTTRLEAFKSGISQGKKVIVPSNVARSRCKNALILDYKKWIETDDCTHDSSAVIAMNLLKYCEVNSVFLAGFDGFSININDNYYDYCLRRPLNEEQAKIRNKYNKQLFDEVKASGLNICFITPSRYE